MSPADLADPEAFARAYRDHHAAVVHAAATILGDDGLAADVAQDVFLRLWRRPTAFDPSRGDLRAYLRLLARSRALDLWRERDARRRATARLPPPEPQRPGRTPHEIVQRRTDAAVVRQAVRHLPAHQREAVVLAYWRGLSSAEISRRQAIPLGTAKSRLRLGLRRLAGEVAAAGCAGAAR